NRRWRILGCAGRRPRTETPSIPRTRKSGADRLVNGDNGLSGMSAQPGLDDRPNIIGMGTSKIRKPQQLALLMGGPSDDRYLTGKIVGDGGSATKNAL